MFLVFTLYERFEEQAIAGKRYSEDQFTFGQVLAAMTWLGTLVDYVYILACI
jgi:hypothetical protein